MMTGIFSSFEPINQSYMSMWMAPLMVMFMTKQSNSKTEMMMMKIKKAMMKETKMLNKNKMVMMMSFSIFLSISMTNLYAMNPISYTITSQASTVLPMSIPLFMAALSMKMMMNMKNLMTSFVPKNCPKSMSPMLVLIELVSLMIRPITLSIRLMANLMSGHLIMHLLTNMAMTSKPIMMSTMLMSSMMTSAEIIMAILQAYIFFTLMTIYYSD